MAEEKIVIEIGEDGEVNVDLLGFKGKGCAAIVDIMEKALGPAQRRNKPEYDDRGSAAVKPTETLKTRS